MSKYTLLKNKATNERSIRNNKTGEVIAERDQPEIYADLRKKALSNLQSASRNDAYRSCGLTRVVGARGGVYWE